MSKISKKNLSVIIILCIVGVILGLRIINKPLHSEVVQENLVRAKGDPNAPLKIVEYIDFQCPACGVGAKYLKKFMHEHPGVVYLEMKYFPLPMHKFGFVSARYAECADRQGQFWPMHDLLVERQKDWLKLNNARPAFDLIAKEVGMDMEALKVCFEDPSVNETIMKDRNEGKGLGVKSTPSYFINQELFVGSKSLKQELNKFLDNAKN